MGLVATNMLSEEEQQIAELMSRAVNDENLLPAEEVMKFSELMQKYKDLGVLESLDNLEKES